MLLFAAVLDLQVRSAIDDAHWETIGAQRIVELRGPCYRARPTQKGPLCLAM